MANAFGGGVANSHRSLCGGLTGGLIMIGVLYDGKAADLGQTFLDAFKSTFGSHICCDVVGIDFDDQEQVDREKQRTSDEICRPMLKRMCGWLAEKLEKVPESAG